VAVAVSETGVACAVDVPGAAELVGVAVGTNGARVGVEVGTGVLAAGEIGPGFDVGVGVLVGIWVGGAVAVFVGTGVLVAVAIGRLVGVAVAVVVVGAVMARAC
jgi:hypothetical protein